MTETDTQGSHKVVLIGPGGVGKTTWLRRLQCGKFEKEYIPTIGVEVNPVVHRGVRLDIWDCAGQKGFGIFREGYYVGAEAAIVMVDDETRDKDGEFWSELDPKIPVVFVHNVKKDPTLGSFSVKEGYNLGMPLDSVLQDMVI